MLVLSRRVLEKIRIGDDIIITLCDTSSGKARIGIECPREIPVHREEVYQAIQDKKKGLPK